MKLSYIAFTFFLCVAHLQGQNKIAEEIQKLEQKNTIFTPVSLLTVDNTIATAGLTEVVTGATLAKVNLKNLAKVAADQAEFIELKVPYQNQIFQIQLYRVNPFSDNFSIDTDKTKNITYEKGAYYRGIIKDNKQSVASFNFFNGEFNGVFSSANLGNVVVGKLDKANNQEDYIVYSDANFLITNDFECHTEDPTTPTTISSVELGVNTIKCVNFYFEIDYNIFLSNGSSILQTTNWMTSVFNNVQTLFDNSDIDVALNAMFIWTTPDIYDGIGASSSDYLFAFRENRPTINGDVGMLVGIDPGGLGGVAFLNSICQNFNHSYSDINGISVVSVPTYSWTTQVISHEFGHSLGSPHTHACVWNGNNTPIDGCGSQAGYPENGCTIIGPIPTAAEKGSIMSYCHLVSGVGISFANGFGPQPSILMANTVNSKPCLSTDCLSSCYNTVTNIQLAAVSTNTATLTWQDTDLEITSWQISVAPTGSSPVWTTVAQPSFQAAGLSANTYYSVRIRPVCTSSTVSTANYIFATNGNFCASLPFTDTGGVQNNYGNREAFTRTMIPNQPNSKIVVTFTQFALEEDYDFLYIYDGSSDTAPELNFGNGFTGINSPGTIVSSAADGALTFKFRSDEVVTDAGWSATISCQETLGISNQSFVDFSYFPNPTSHLIALKSNTAITEIKVYNVEGRLLLTQKLDLLETNVDLAAFASGTYFFKVKFDTIEKNFKVLKL